MSWATRQRRTMEDERIMPTDMQQEVRVRVVRAFVFDDLEGRAGDRLTLPRWRGEYLRFRQLVEYEHTD